MSVPFLQFSNTLVVNTRDRTDKQALKDLWADKPVVFLFLRRLGCMICRSYAAQMEKLRPLIEKKGGRVICMSFEFFGEGSDEDRSFEAIGFWKGPLYTIDKSVYTELFGRKGLFDNFYGLLDMNKEAVKKATATNIPGNFKGDGFQLGGQFVVSNEGKVVFEHRQKLFGDDASFDSLYTAISSCLPPSPSSTPVPSS
jgi:prostamide/prostaglandin F2alpha synthase